MPRIHGRYRVTLYTWSRIKHINDCRALYVLRSSFLLHDLPRKVRGDGTSHAELSEACIRHDGSSTPMGRGAPDWNVSMDRIWGDEYAK